MDLENHTLGGYLIGHKLGEGGMGAVYSATQVRLGRVVALKIMAPALATNQEITARFLREGQTIAALDHPNILPVYEAGEAYSDTGEGPFSYIAMRYVDGGTLHDLIRRNGPLKPSHALALLEQAAAGLQAAHKRGFVHRDIKSSNLLLDPPAEGQRSEHLSIADFGIVKLLDNTTDSFKTGTGLVVGTPAYMAPEQLQGAPVDGRADVYALTVVLYEMLKGAVPFQAETPAMVMYRKMSETPPAFNAAASGLPPALDAVIARGLTPAPEQRFATPKDLVEALRQALAAQPTQVFHTTGVDDRSGSITPPPTPGMPTPPPVPGSSAGQPTAVATTNPQAIPTPEHPPTMQQPPARGKAPSPLLWGALIVLVILVLGGGIVLAGAVLRNRSGGEDAASGGVTSTETLPQENPTPPPPPPTRPPPPPTQPPAEQPPAEQPPEGPPPAEQPPAEQPPEGPPPEGPPPEGPPPPGRVRGAELDSLFENTGGTFGIVFSHNSRGEDTYTRNPDQTFPAADLVTLPIALTAYHRAEQDPNISMDDQLPVQSEDPAGGTDTGQQTPPGTASLRDLCVRVVRDADAGAATLILEHIGGTAQVNDYMGELGADATTLQPPPEAGGITTPSDMHLLLQLLQQGAVPGHQEILQAMEKRPDQTSFAPDVVIRNKARVLESRSHQIALIATPSQHEFIVVMMSSDVESGMSRETMQQAAKILFAPRPPPPGPNGDGRP
jgi:serine/threonine protein kinase